MWVSVFDGNMNLIAALTLTMALLSACRIFQVVLQAFLVKLNIWLEDRALKKSLGTEDIPTRSFVEEQSKYADFHAGWWIFPHHHDEETSTKGDVWHWEMEGSYSGCQIHFS